MDIEKLEKQVTFSKWLISVVFTLTVTSYLVTFGWKIQGGSAEFGQFGDYMGGVMNPLIAFGAFYWLATSVLLQKRELSDTRAALEASGLAQQEHAKTALLTARIQTINIKLSGVTGHINQLRERLSALYLFQGQHGGGRTYWDDNGVPSSPSGVIGQVRAELENLLLRESELLGEIDSLSEHLQKRPFKLGSTVI